MSKSASCDHAEGAGGRGLSAVTGCSAPTLASGTFTATHLSVPILFNICVTGVHLSLPASSFGTLGHSSSCNCFLLLFVRFFVVVLRRFCFLRSCFLLCLSLSCSL